jgi:hypothetical protein
MASGTGVRTELYRDQFGVLLEDLDRRMLELKWLEGSASMSDEDFKAWLDRFSAEAETRRQPHLVINVRQFRHRPGPEIAPWRDQHVIPRYNRAGVTKFAFLLPEGSPGAGGLPVPEPPGAFPTGYFDQPSKIETWFNL